MKQDDLFIKQFFDEGLGNSSYLNGSTTTARAAVIDPQRDVDRYFQVAEGMGLRLVYSFDTHLHADFVSGPRELATPGHTPENISFTVTPVGSIAPHSIFTGGALVVGGAARTDLPGHEFSEPLARQLYHTLHDKLLRFHDEVQIYPTHGGGSFCAAPTSNERTTTIGRERHTNRLAQVFTEDEFVRLSLNGLPSYPAYYRYLREVNRIGPRLLGKVPVLEPLSPRDVEEALTNGVAVIRGYLDGGIAAWHAAGLPTARTRLIDVDELHAWMKRNDALLIVDVRSDAEWRAGHMPDAIHIEAGRITESAATQVPRERPVVLHCGAANRATVGLSLLERLGYRNLMMLNTGFRNWQDAGYEVVKEAA